MKEQDDKLTLQETEQLCRLYMDCELTVLEETELQYVLEKLPYSSPCIDEVRIMMGLDIKIGGHKKNKNLLHFFRNRKAVSMAASFTILLGIGISVIIKSSDTQDTSLSAKEQRVYITAYHHGEQLNRREAVASTKIAMAKADSLMRYASLADREYLLKANAIISATSNN